MSVGEAPTTGFRVVVKLNRTYSPAPAGLAQCLGKSVPRSGSAPSSLTSSYS